MGNGNDIFGNSEDKLKKFAEENNIPLDILKQELELQGNKYTYTDAISGPPDRTKGDYISGTSKIAESTRELYDLKARGDVLKAEAEREGQKAKYYAARQAESGGFWGGMAATGASIGAGLAGVDITDKADRATQLHGELARTALQQGATLKEADAFAQLAMETAGITRKEGDVAAQTIEEEGRLKQLEADLSYEDKKIADFNKMKEDYMLIQERRIDREIKFRELDSNLEFLEWERKKAKEQYDRQKGILDPLEKRNLELNNEKLAWDVQQAGRVARGESTTAGNIPGISGGKPVVDFGGFMSTLRMAADPTSNLWAKMNENFKKLDLSQSEIDAYRADPTNINDTDLGLLNDMATLFVRTFGTLNDTDSTIRKAVMMIGSNGGPKNLQEQIMVNKFALVKEYASMADDIAKDVKKTSNTQAQVFLKYFGYSKDGRVEDLEGLKATWAGIYELSKDPEQYQLKEYTPEQIQTMTEPSDVGSGVYGTVTVEEGEEDGNESDIEFLTGESDSVLMDDNMTISTTKTSPVIVEIETDSVSTAEVNMIYKQVGVDRSIVYSEEAEKQMANVRRELKGMPDGTLERDLKELQLEGLSGKLTQEEFIGKYKRTLTYHQYK